MMANPELAKWMMFEKPAIESGVEYDDDVKEKMWWEYQVGYLSYFWFHPCKSC